MFTILIIISAKNMIPPKTNNKLLGTLHRLQQEASNTVLEFVWSVLSCTL